MMSMTDHKFRASYPITIVYLAGVGIVLAIYHDIIRVETGIIILTFLSLGMVLIAMFREVRAVHILVNSQRDELVARITALTEALVAAGVRVPDAPDETSNDEPLYPRRTLRGRTP